MRNNDDTGQEFNPRHRIVGAIILVSLAVIFLPMILDERKPPAPAIKQISEIPAPGANTLALNRPATAQKAEASADAPGLPNSVPLSKPAARPLEQTALAKPRPNSTSNRDAEEKASYRPPAEKNAAVTPLADTAEKGWFVQVGTFSNRENAKQLADKLKQDGFSVKMEDIRLATGKAVRVRVGPFLEDTAKDAQQHIEKSVGIKGVILAYQ